jgi:8-oxo-dGTP pyrophosphatase MutT (NUDIX family)
MQLNEGLREQVRARLAAFPARRAGAQAAHAAAVALVLVEEGSGAQVAGISQPAGWSGDAALLLTRRPLTMSRHAGQWALPGGRIDAGESARAAALRELQEEVGLELPPGALLGTLDDYATRSGFVITPLVFWGGRAEVLRPNAEEVASIHRVPVAELMRDDLLLVDEAEVEGRPILRIRVGDTWIAAPTAAVLYQFREVCIAGRATRVAHFDQPLFARS